LSHTRISQLGHFVSNLADSHTKLVPSVEVLAAGVKLVPFADLGAYDAEE
jgi:hypothetical protein